MTDSENSHRLKGLLGRLGLFMRGLLCVLLLYLASFFTMEANAARIEKNEQYFPVAFAKKDLGTGGLARVDWIPETYGTVKKRIPEQIEAICNKAFFTTNTGAIKEALKTSFPLTEDLCSDKGVLYEQFFTTIEPLTKQVLAEYLKTKRHTASYTDETWKLFINLDKGLLHNISRFFLYAKSVEVLGGDIRSLVDDIHVWDNFNKKDFWNVQVTSYKTSIHGNDYLIKGLEESLQSLKSTVDDFKKAKTNFEKETWKSLIGHLFKELNLIKCVDEKGKTANSWSFEGYIAGLGSVCNTSDQNFLTLVSTVTALNSAETHPAVRYYRQSREMSLGMIRRANSTLVGGADSLWQKLGAYIYDTMKASPERYLTNVLTHGQVVKMFSEGLSSQTERKALMEQYIAQVDNAQEVVVPLIVLQTLLKENQTKLEPSNLVKLIETEEQKNLKMIQFIRQMADDLTDNKTKAIDAEKKMRTDIEMYSRTFRDPEGDPLQQHKQQAVGVIVGTGLVILLQNPEMRDGLFLGDLGIQTKAIDILFRNAVTMGRALFDNKTKPGDTIRYRFGLYVDIYKQQLLQTILKLAPSRGELSLGRTQKQLENMTAVYTQLPSIHRGEYGGQGSILRTLTFLDTKTGKTRHRIIATMPLNNHGGGQCWAYGLRTGGEPSVKSPITSLYGEGKYKELHVDQDKKYVADSYCYQVLGDYIKYMRPCTGMNIVYEEKLLDRTSIADSFDTKSIDARLDCLVYDSMYAPRIATSQNGGKHFWISADLTDVLDITQNMRMWKNK